MSCLNPIHIQALADGEGTDAARVHVASCSGCAARLREREALLAEMSATINPPIDVPPSVVLRTGGATRLRSAGGVRLQREGLRRWVYPAVGLTAASLVAVFVVAPAVRHTEVTVSAAEILAKSATQLSAATTGVELLEYELVLDGVPKEMLADQANGRYHVRQVIDHDVPGRFRFATFGPDGQMISSIAQDPKAARRVMAFLADGQPFRYDVTLPKDDAGLSLPEMERLHMQASIALMQASGNQLFSEVPGPDGPMYRIEVPQVSGPGTNPVWDLTEARVLIDGRDFRVREFFVRGRFLKRDYSMSFTLISRQQASKVNEDMFQVPHLPDEIVITGQGTAVPTHDVLMLGLRELTKLKQGR
jgi:hypothetical protein